MRRETKGEACPSSWHAGALLPLARQPVRQRVGTTHFLCTFMHLTTRRECPRQPRRGRHPGTSPQ